MAETRLRYTGPIDGVELSIGRRGVVVERDGEIDLAEHLPIGEAARVAKGLLETGAWSVVGKTAKAKGDDTPGGDS